MRARLEGLEPVLADDSPGECVETTEGFVVTGPDGKSQVMSPPIEVSMPPPANAENFVCTVGRCKHYGAMLLGGTSVNRPEERDMRRFCTRLSSDESGPLELTEQVVFACTFYDPDYVHHSIEVVNKRKHANDVEMTAAHYITATRR